jgi:hypothetical protein
MEMWFLNGLLAGAPENHGLTYNATAFGGGRIFAVRAMASVVDDVHATGGRAVLRRPAFGLLGCQFVAYGVEFSGFGARILGAVYK